MRPHVIWRNPSPPPRVKFTLRCLVRSVAATVYQVASPNYRHPFEVSRTTDPDGGTLEVTEGEAPSAISPAELVSARW